MVPLPANAGVAAPAARPIMPAKNNIPQDRTMPPSSAPHSLAALFLAPLLLAGALVLPLAGAQAQSIERLGDFSNWSAFESEENCRLVCLRPDEHTSELQSLMRNSYADTCLKQKNKN